MPDGLDKCNQKSRNGGIFYDSSCNARCGTAGFAAVAGLILLLILIIKFKVHAMISILIGAVGIGLMAGMPLSDIIGSVNEGIGNTLKGIALLVGLGDVIGNAVANASLPLVLVAFIVAALVRISVGSATVAMTMAAGIISAMPGLSELSPLYLACVTAAIAGGSTVCSHFNDSGFWLVKSLVGMDEKTTLKTWTIMETLVGGVGFLVALVISFFA